MEATTNHFIKNKDIYESKLRIVFSELTDRYANGKSGYCLTKEQCADALCVSLKSLQDMLKSGTAPTFFRVSTAKQSAYRFHTIDVAKFLIEKG